jgi:hypothetical protein
MWHDDRNSWMSYQPEDWVRKHLIKFPGGYRIRKGEIRDYFDETFLRCAVFINRYREFGLPYAKGWNEHPKHMIEIIELFNRAQAREYRSRGNSTGNRSKSNPGRQQGAKGPFESRQIGK